MNDLLVLALKGLAGGVLVTMFALLSEAVRPKRFAGLFGASPAVAIAGLTLVLIDQGTSGAHRSTIGMTAGAVGLVVYTVTVVPLLSRWNARRAAAAALIGWVAGAALAAVPLLLLT